MPERASLSTLTLWTGRSAIATGSWEAGSTVGSSLGFVSGKLSATRSFLRATSSPPGAARHGPGMEPS